MKIFICEQDQGKAKSMQAILGRYSYKVIAVQKNTDLFKQVNRQRPAVIIVNESFNEFGSVETINRLKNDPKTSTIPVIYIGNENKALSGLYPKENSFLEIVQEPVKIKNLKNI